MEIILNVDSSPTFKPNVKWSFRNAQKIFPYLFMNKGINTVKDIKINIQNIINFYNNSYDYKIPQENSFIAISDEEIEDMVVINSQRTISTGNVIKVNNQWLA